MAIADFGGTVLGRKIVTLVADHQNKPDIGASKFREWADQNGLNVLLGGSNTGVSIAMAKVAAAKKVPFFVIGAGGASLTNEDCTAYTVHYVYDTTALANGTATTIVKNGGKTWFFLTADYAFGTQLQNAASKVVEANGGKILGAVRVPLAASDFSSFLLQAQGSGAQVLGARQRGRRFQQLAQGGQRVRHHQEDEAGGAARLHHQHPQPRPADRAGAVPDHGLVLGPERRDARLRQALLREDAEGADHGSGGLLLRHDDLPQGRQGCRHTDSDKVMAELKKMKINDMFAKGGYIRADGVMVHTMYVMQVKSPQESKYPWDYYKVLKLMQGEGGVRPDHRRVRSLAPGTDRPRRADFYAGSSVTEVFGIPVAVILGQLMLGLVNGSFYAMLSLGLAVIFGLMGVVNFAHGAFYALGAFAALLGLQWFGINYWAALVLAPLAVGLLGIAAERLLLRHIYQLEPLYGLLLTFGLALVIEGLLHQFLRLLRPVLSSPPRSGRVQSPAS